MHESQLIGQFCFVTKEMCYLNIENDEINTFSSIEKNIKSYGKIIAIDDYQITIVEDQTNIQFTIITARFYKLNNIIIDYPLENLLEKKVKIIKYSNKTLAVLTKEKIPKVLEKVEPIVPELSSEIFPRLMTDNFSRVNDRLNFLAACP